MACGYRGDVSARQKHPEQLRANFKMLQKQYIKVNFSSSWGRHFGHILSP